jgi:hypothetical protein
MAEPELELVGVGPRGVGQVEGARAIVTAAHDSVTTGRCARSNQRVRASLTLLSPGPRNGPLSEAGPRNGVIRTLWRTVEMPLLDQLQSGRFVDGTLRVPRR